MIRAPTKPHPTDPADLIGDYGHTVCLTFTHAENLSDLVSSAFLDVGSRTESARAAHRVSQAAGAVAAEKVSPAASTASRSPRAQSSSKPIPR